MDILSLRQFTARIADLDKPVQVVTHDKATGNIRKLGVWTPESASTLEDSTAGGAREMVEAVGLVDGRTAKAVLEGVPFAIQPVRAVPKPSAAKGRRK